MGGERGFAVCVCCVLTPFAALLSLTGHLSLAICFLSLVLSSLFLGLVARIRAGGGRGTEGRSNAVASWEEEKAQEGAQMAGDSRSVDKAVSPGNGKRRGGNKNCLLILEFC